MVEGLGKKSKKKKKAEASEGGEAETKGKQKSPEEVLMEREAKYLEKVQRKTEKEVRELR